MNKNLILTLLAGLLAMTATAAEPPALAPMDKEPTLPFAIRIAETVEMPDLKPLYYSDYPSGLTVIEGDLWFIGKNGDRPHVVRKKGKNIEELEGLPGGTAGSDTGKQPPYTEPPYMKFGSFMEDPAKGRCLRPYILGGIWYDPAGKRIYAPLHCEYFWNKWGIQRQIHLASSADLGLTWSYEGAIFLHDDPRRSGAPVEARCAESSGALWDSGHGDHHLFTDEKTGFHYLFSNHYLRGKRDVRSEKICSRHQVVRCRIADKMAPDKWRKFHNGTWDEPGAGGKGSYVNGYCVTYNTYLNKYLSFDWGGGVSACDDLEKQDWTPIFKIPGASWGFGDERRHLSWYVADEAKRTGDRTGQSFYVYTGFGLAKGSGRGVPVRHRIELGPGKTFAAQGFIASGTAGWEAGGGPSAEPDRAYSSRPWPDSGDPVEARRTLPAQAEQVTFTGQWKGAASDQVGSAVRCAFQAGAIYYRHAAGPDCGRADVYLDGAHVKTLDCWSAQKHSLQFGVIRTGLDPAKPHTLEIRVRGDKHPLSTGTAVAAGAFEYSADCYRASDGFSSVQGKNQWRYVREKEGQYVELAYADPMTWTGEDACAIGIASQTPGASEVARTWTAPHDGAVRLQGNVAARDTVQWDPLIVYVDDETKAEAPKAPAKPDPKAAIEARILKNNEALWTARIGWAAHDLRVAVKTGDVIAFATKLLAVERRPEK